MRTALYVLLLSGGLLAQTVQATGFVIDASQSYLELDIPTWRQGDPFSFAINDMTGETISGYQWFPDTRTERYELSGRFEMLEGQAQSDGRIPFGWTGVELYTNAPSVAQFNLPGSLAYDSVSGQISKHASSCPPLFEGGIYGCFILAPADYSSVSGSLSGSLLVLEGVQQTGVSFSYTTQFSPEKPLDPELTNPAVRYHLVAAAVPEPGVALTMLAGLALIYAAKRRSLGHHRLQENNGI